MEVGVVRTVVVGVAAVTMREMMRWRMAAGIVTAGIRRGKRRRLKRGVGVIEDASRKDHPQLMGGLS
jgi:hypothetical protein